MSVKRKDVEEAADMARKIVRGLGEWPLSMVVPSRYRKWAKAIADVLRDVCPLVPE